MTPVNDGNNSWDGGMDMSRHPTFIDKNQYRFACNLILPKKNGGIRTRFGIHHVNVEFENECDRDHFELGNFQAEGSFSDPAGDYLLVASNGFVYLLIETFSGKFKAINMNPSDRNSEDVMQGYFTTVPNGAIYNDGLSLPLIISSSGARRSDPEKNEITSGKMGVYVQNRFWYVTPDQREIKYSNFQDPYNISESINYNVSGYYAPEDSDLITAIGAQKKMLNYAEGGVLVFSTTRNIYSIDVRGSAEDWEEVGAGVGKVQESVKGIAATSHNSFTVFNTNLYFRTKDFGICDLRQSQYQFQQSDDFVSQSIEVDSLLDDDTPWMLDQCYTKSFQGRVLTTIAPEFNDKGRVFWNGIVSYHPRPMYSGLQASPRRFEGIFTGVRPWAITTPSSSQSRANRMYIWSYDADGITRLYKMEPNSHYDINHHGTKIRVRSFLETRGYNHGNQFIRKKPTSRAIALSDIDGNLEISFYSKSESQGNYVFVCKNEYRAKMLNQLQDLSLTSGQKQQRCHESLPEEKNNNEKGKPSGNQFYFRSERFECVGDFSLDSFYRTSNLESPDMNVSSGDSSDIFEVYEEMKMFKYSIATSQQ